MISLKQARRLPPIHSGYRSASYFRVTAPEDGEGWILREERLSATFVKEYDTGLLDEWLETYTETAPLASLRFIAAELAGRPAGLLTWTHWHWNNVIWLVDVRVREEDRRQGVGNALLAELRRESGALDPRGILVETQTTNAPAIRFYRQHGFRFCGINDHLYSNDDLDHQDVAVFLFQETASDDH